MKITRLMVSDFGKFHQREIMLAPGLNIATGANESGKTTLRRFIRSMFYGLERERGIKARKDDYTRFKPWEHGRFQGILEFESGGKEYRLFRNFLTTEKKVTLTELSSGNEIEQPEEFLYRAGLLSESIYVNTFWVGNNCATEEHLAVELKDYLANLAYSGGAGFNLQKSLGWLAARKRELQKQMPEQELSECMELLLSQETLRERVAQARHAMEENLHRQKELEAAIAARRDIAEQEAMARHQLEQEEKLKEKGERRLTLLLILAAGLAIAAFFLPGWLLNVAGWIFALAALFTGLITGRPLIRRGRLAIAKKAELEQQMLLEAKELQACYEELTALLPRTEQERFGMEQAEEQFQQCELAKERYEELKQRKQELQREAEAVTLAKNTLEQLSDDLYEEFGSKFANALSAYAKAFTDHAYDTLVADEDLTLKTLTKERSLELSDVSFGTGEQFYLALRFAAADVFDPEKKNPMILDDSFAAYDDQRLESAILALQKCGRQIILFSSTGREEAAAKRMGITYEAIF